MDSGHENQQPASAESAPRGTCIQLGATCTIREAGDLKQQLLAHLEAPPPLFIDGSAVERADTASVQLLVAFSLDCMERGIEYGWAGRSPALNRAIDLLGVGPLVESPGTASYTPPKPSAASAASPDGEQRPE